MKTAQETKKKLGPYLTLHTKTTSTWINDLNTTGQNLKLLEEYGGDFGTMNMNKLQLQASTLTKLTETEFFKS